MMIVDLTLQDNSLIMNGTDSLPSGKSFEIWKTSLIHKLFYENYTPFAKHFDMKKLFKIVRRGREKVGVGDLPC